VFAISVLSFGSPASAAPPAVQPDGSAQSNCQSIVNAGYSPNDYVLRGGKWRYEPGYSGTNSVRMSSLWGSASTCRNGSTIQPKIRIVVTPPKIRRTEPAPQRQGQNQVVQDPVIHDPDDPEPLKRREEEREREPHNMVPTLGDPNVAIHYTGNDPNDRSTWTWLRPDHDEWCDDGEAITAGCGRLVGEIQYENIGRADPNKKKTVTIKGESEITGGKPLTDNYNNDGSEKDSKRVPEPRKTKVVKNPRVELSGAEWYRAYGSEHPFGASYDPNKPDPNFGCDNVYGPGFSDTRCGRD